MCQACRKQLHELEIKFARLINDVMNHNKVCESGCELNFHAVFVAPDGEVTDINCMSSKAADTVLSLALRGVNPL